MFSILGSNPVKLITSRWNKPTVEVSPSNTCFLKDEEAEHHCPPSSYEASVYPSSTLGHMTVRDPSTSTGFTITIERWSRRLHRAISFSASPWPALCLFMIGVFCCLWVTGALDAAGKQTRQTVSTCMDFFSLVWMGANLCRL
ncbi:hypothetical protein P152DRAFT_458327 [Eremomyces bilateralis CBS 781.70]|uniref:Uncharacterized protein n=1 Tax=Eremomyces bilateralis CBS 781.70 TaxID=1392243 RepID=A0A6G1G361_9PEZI|nr:uncharacterized protein P152DRAFT_458327 [Eremomyces bilateralis CBS 781.70]KAF1812483.1 hypothetical protein P152DRAFT_458327 [Eremomyces bilateralis CBS 781.70]